MTVGSGIGPDLLTLALGGRGSAAARKALAGSRVAAPTAGGEFRPALKTLLVVPANRRGEFTTRGVGGWGVGMGDGWMVCSVGVGSGDWGSD